MNSLEHILGEYAAVNSPVYEHILEEYLGNPNQKLPRLVYLEKQVEDNIDDAFGLLSDVDATLLSRLLEQALDKTVIRQDLARFNIMLDDCMSVVNRNVILVVDSADRFATADTLKDYIRAFTKANVPDGSTYTHFILGFPILSSSDLSRFREAILTTLGTHVDNLVVYSIPVEADLTIAGVAPEHVAVFGYEECDMLIGDLLKISFTSSNLIELLKRVDDYYETTLKGKYIKTATNAIIDKHKMDLYLNILAYLDTKYKANLVMSRKIQSMLVPFLDDMYVQYRFFTMYDKIMFFKNYPEFVINNKSLDLFLYRVIPERKSVLVDLSYFDGNVVVSKSLDIREVDMQPLVTSTDEVTSELTKQLLILENELDNTFLNIKNCVYLDVDGDLRLCYIKQLQPKFSVNVIQVDETNEVFTQTLTPDELLSIIPLDRVTFEKDSRGRTALHAVFKLDKTLGTNFLSQVDTLADCNSLYMPEYAADLAGVLFYKISALMLSNGTHVPINNQDSLKFKIYSTINHILCNNSVDFFVDRLDVRRLRHNVRDGENAFLDLFGLVTNIKLQPELLRNVYL